jgi:hypothetical protein
MFHVIGIILVATYNKKALKIEIANMMQDQLSDKVLDEKPQNNRKTYRRTLPLNNSMAEEEKWISDDQPYKAPDPDKKVKFKYLDMVWMAIPWLKYCLKPKTNTQSRLYERIQKFEFLSSKYTSQVDCISILSSLETLKSKITSLQRESTYIDKKPSFPSQPLTNTLAFKTQLPAPTPSSIVKPLEIPSPVAPTLFLSR